MSAGGKRIGSGRKEKYSEEEKFTIIDVCEKVWETKKQKTGHVLIRIKKDRNKVTTNEIWNTQLRGSDVKKFESIEEAKTSMNKILSKDTQPSLHGNLFERPKSRDQCVKLAQIIISKLYPERYHRANTIDKIWKTRNR